MRVSKETVDAILLDDAPGAVYVSDWEDGNNGDVLTFVLQVGNKYYKGEVVRLYKTVEAVIDDEGVEVKPATETVIYSHEANDGVDSKEVKKECVKENGKRTIRYR